MHAVKPPVLHTGGRRRGTADGAGDSMEIRSDTPENMTFEIPTRETRWTVLAAVMIASMVALSTVAAGAATAAAADADDGADTDLEMTVDAPNSIETTGSSTFDVTVNTADGEPATTDVVFEISGEGIQEEVTASTDDTGSVTFTAEGIALSEGEYEWTVTAGDEERSGTLTVTGTADDGATDDTADNDTEAAGNDTAGNNTTASENDTAADNTTDNDSEVADNDTEAAGNDSETADNDSETEEDESVPGFGIAGTLSALVAGTLLLIRQRS
ncbi:PGF-CTERM sorting domain-containing protein [Haloterrigena salinisoli]|uniref:PGF-CTERM sorting domain-containing protein n=1 Tax=Haloterrigena salinisoli TaxID=3132747 RepID=UPI0030CE98A2